MTAKRPRVWMPNSSIVRHPDEQRSRNRRPVRLLALLLLVLAACSRPREGGLNVTVEIGSGATSRCLQVAAKHGGAFELRSNPVAIAGKTQVAIGVAQGKLPDNIVLYAEGFSDPGCSTPSDPPERSRDVAAGFLPGTVRDVMLTLPAAGPGRETACADGLDSDGDSVTDCMDSDCDALPCFGGGTCREGTCRGASTEKNLCADGFDNDSDGATDCADADCLGSLCRSPNACVTGTTCDAAKACSGGSAKPCNTAPACRSAAGTCDPMSGQCSYAPLAMGTACSDGNACTAPDVCDGAGTCVAGQPMGCASPPGACFTAAGATCDPVRGCVYPVAAAAACDDGLSCTTGDGCLADGGCAGVAVACAPTGCQTFSGQCGADAGCLFANAAAGTACDAGVCNAGGGCVPLFPYTPANFVESQVPTPPPGDIVLGCGTSVIDTQAAGPPVFMNWCGQPLPGAATISQAGGPDAVLLSVTRLTVAAGAVLRVQGPRPVILAATGDVSVAGLVEVLAGASDCAAGGATAGVEGTTNGGGGGGSFATSGGNGGAGSTPLFGSAGAGGAAGAVNGNAALVPLRGGCPGALGARSGVPRAAAGGGALQISSAAAIFVSGALTAPGQGGAQAGNGTGGNGAGSGGAIALEALQLTLSQPGSVTAHGGGGGEGAGPLQVGVPGESGHADAGAAAGGSNGLQTGGPGGDGAVPGVAAGAGQAGTFGTGNGGGGGGGLGRVRLRALSCSVGVGVLVSPPAPADGGC